MRIHREWKWHSHGNLESLLVGLDVAHRMDFDPAAPDSPRLPQPFAPVGDLDPGTVDGEDLGRYGEREIQAVDPAKEGGRVRRRETGGECHELPDNPLHLAIGHL